MIRVCNENYTLKVLIWKNNDLIFCRLTAKIAGPIRKTSPHTQHSPLFDSAPMPMQAQIKSPGARIYNNIYLQRRAELFENCKKTFPSFHSCNSTVTLSGTYIHIRRHRAKEIHRAFSKLKEGSLSK